MEKFSKKRGRPTSSIMKDAKRVVVLDGCNRTTINGGYLTLCHKALHTESEEFAHTVSMVRGGNFKRGYKTMAVEVGRYLYKSGCDPVEVKNFIKEAIEAGLSFRDIGYHFRIKRLGERSGNTDALVKMICRNIDDFWKTFPKTPKWEIIEALQKVTKHVSTHEIKEEI